MPWNISFKKLSLSRQPLPPPSSMGACLSTSDCPCEDSITPSTDLTALAISTSHFVRLSGYDISPFTARIRIALHFKGIQPDIVEVPRLTSTSIDQPQGCAWLDATFHDGRFPRLEHGTDVITGSPDSILDYIESKFPQPSLYPSWKLNHKAKTWVSYVRDVFSPLLVEAWSNRSLNLDQDLYDKVGAAFARLNSGLAESSKRGEFFMGKHFTMVDVYLIPFLELLEPLRFLHGVEVDGHEHPRLAEYVRRMASFPSYIPVAVDGERFKVMATKELEERSKVDPAVSFTVLQHTSILRHLERLVNVADEMVEFYNHQGKCTTASNSFRGKFRRSKTVITKREAAQRVPSSAQVGLNTRLRRAGGDYERLLTLLKEHAQMEERVIFSALEKAQRGITKLAIEEHAREFPLMNGVREYFKMVLVHEHGSRSQVEALATLAAKLHILKDSTVNHFGDEQKELLPLLGAAGLGAKQQELLGLEGINAMKASHSELLPFLLSALHAHETHRYMIILRRCLRHGTEEKTRVEDLVRVLRSDDEFPEVWQVVRDRVPLLAATSAVS